MALYIMHFRVGVGSMSYYGYGLLLLIVRRGEPCSLYGCPRIPPRRLKRIETTRRSMESCTLQVALRSAHRCTSFNDATADDDDQWPKSRVTNIVIVFGFVVVVVVAYCSWRPISIK
jgi:hypothetical protein